MLEVSADWFSQSFDHGDHDAENDVLYLHVGVAESAGGLRVSASNLKAPKPWSRVESELGHGSGRAGPARPLVGLASAAT